MHEFYLQSEDEDHKTLTEQIESLSKQEPELRKPLTTVMVMGDMDKPRETFVFHRGAYDSPTRDEGPTGNHVRPSADGCGRCPRNRLGLARWLFSDDHPLTARVAVNRYWQIFFGSGLVSTPADFGAQGEFPTHPQLLDYLAIDFRDSGWNVKRLMKQIVMSSTYRQSSAAPAELYQRDPTNLLFARGPRFRLHGEFIRDTALGSERTAEQAGWRPRSETVSASGAMGRSRFGRQPEICSRSWRQAVPTKFVYLLETLGAAAVDANL